MALPIFTPTTQQQQAIDFRDGDALVLAPPGCGKTHVLAYRVAKAHTDYGIPYSDMLCLTFTNRASREMQQRVRQTVGETPHGLFIGNLHRFCILFLQENELLPLDTSIIDEEDQIEIITEMGKREENDQNNNFWVSKIVKWADIYTKKELGFPAHLIAMGRTRDEMLPDYEKPIVFQYIDYKREHRLIDYDDIINMAYAAMMRDDFKTLKMSNYPWIQIDEVQDLNSLQLAIVEKLIDPGLHTLMYLGDERQAIYSFIGADPSHLLQLKENLQTFSFDTNYRSPKYLLDFINKYAEVNLGVKPADMPQASVDEQMLGGVVLLGNKDHQGNAEAEIIAAQTRLLHLEDANQTICILARTNRSIDQVAELLAQHNIEYLQLTNKDMFKKVDFKTIYSHLAVVANEHRNSEWARLLYQTKSVPKMSKARELVTRLNSIGMSVTDLLRDDDSTYMLEFDSALANGTFVVFDTETTGLDVFADDVIQIAAVKITKHGIVKGSEFVVNIHTDREIPATLANGTPNPMVADYAAADKTSFADAIASFAEYASGCQLISHNAQYDTQILSNNLKRHGSNCYLDSYWLESAWDSLKIARLIDPSLRTHALGALLKYYGIAGVNSHRALDDAKATAAYIKKAQLMMIPLLVKQREDLRDKRFSQVARRLRNQYKSYYDHTLEKLRDERIGPDNTLVAEMQWLYENFMLDKYIKPIPRFHYILELFGKVMINQEAEPHFRDQLLNHVYEMRTYNESDLFQNSIVKEAINLMTIHKAKGLQFDTVFVYGINSIPNSMDWRRGDEGKAEAARMLYVAISRAKRRLFLSYTGRISSFVNKELQKMCATFSPEQLERLRQLEAVYKSMNNE